MKTYGELLTALIAHYEWCVENLPEDWELRDEFLYKNDVEDGMCYCALNKYEKDLHDTDFITDFTNDSVYLCDTPKNSPYEDAKKLLQKRIDRMKRIINRWRDVEIGV